MKRAALSAASLILAFGLLALMPRLVGVSWAEIWQRLGSIEPWALAVLAVVWIAGLGAYTFVLTASLPGLSHGRAFMLNAAGSGVSNLLPFGGAAGVAATFAMATGWGFTLPAITVSTVVSGIWNVFARLLLPAVGILALLSIGRLPNRQLSAAAATAGITLIAIALVIAVALRWEPAAHRVDRLLQRAAEHLPRRAGDLLRSAGSSLLRVRTETLGVLSAGWQRLTLGMAGYMLLQGVLLFGCLWAAGDSLRVAETLAVFAINRVLTSAVVTPGGSGITETGTAALLVHFGMDASAAATAVVLYSFFTHVIEIPLGGVVWAVWLNRRGRTPANLPEA
ncbi:lysylphosphatidylglycerol synthase transmembrane domain-containing protein [Actinocorallia longicatena]|uniref:Lysylphosphatidylglycerol synthase domain-containing protein n=1 Tax=Actinocorallia longicatena TaxID=111803 RepID=A0ABP6QU50_9ACTN